MELRTKRRLYLVAGWSFFVLGILGLVLPILQGALFLMIALIFLARAQPRFRLLKQRFRRCYPRYAVLLDKAEHRAGEIARGRFFRNNRKS